MWYIYKACLFALFFFPVIHLFSNISFRLNTSFCLLLGLHPTKMASVPYVSNGFLRLLLGLCLYFLTTQSSHVASNSSPLTLSWRISVSRCKQEKGDKWHHYSIAFTGEGLLLEKKALAASPFWLASLSSEAGAPAREQASRHPNRWACG